MFWVTPVSDTPFCVAPRPRIGRCIIFTRSISRIATTATTEFGVHTVTRMAGIPFIVCIACTVGILFTAYVVRMGR